jgi:hypothetical protein
MSFSPSVPPRQSSPPPSGPSTLHSTHSQQAPQTPPRRFDSESLTSSSNANDTNVMWQTLTSIRNWVTEKFNAIISCLCCRSNPQNIEESEVNTPSSPNANLPEDVQQLIAPLKSWLLEADRSQPVMNFDRMRIEETPIDAEELLDTRNDNHQAVLDRIKNCTEPTYFTVTHGDHPTTSLIIIPIEVKEDSELDYRPDYLLFDNERSDLKRWDCFDSKNYRLTTISAGTDIDSPWVKTLLQTGIATDEDNDVMYRLRKASQA